MLRCCSLLMRSHLLAGQKLSADVAWNDFLYADVKPCPMCQTAPPWLHSWVRSLALVMARKQNSTHWCGCET